MTAKRTYKFRGLCWADAEMRRTYWREAQRAWRAINRPRKAKRVGA